MPDSRFLKCYIDKQQVDLYSLEDVPVSINYRLEDPSNFQSKKSAESFGLIVPATTTNDRIANTFHNPGFEDLTPGQSYRSFRPALIEANSFELLVGKALLVNARHASCPVSYEYDLYGNNADWLIDLRESTLYDFLKHITFDFTKATIEASWDFDGTDEALPYLFAPVRYGNPLDDYDDSGTLVPDRNMKPEYMKPSISIYWLLFWGFKSIGYRISSTFFDTPLFRKLLMPWTWGNFLFSDGTRLENLDFLAKSTEWVHKLNEDFTGFWDVQASNDSTVGAFDNNGVYTWDAVNFEMKWEYLPAFDYGALQATFYFNMFINAVATANSDVELRIKWFKNGVYVPHGNDNGNGNMLVNLNAPAVGRKEFNGPVEDWFTTDVVAGDIISAKMYLHTFDSGTGIARIHGHVDAFELDYFRIPLGGTIDFETYTAFKNYKFLDFVAGILDSFNISPQTDPINKVVVMEPMHPYSLTDDLSAPSGGYFNGKFLDWSEKQDVKNESELPLFSDSDRELLFKFKDDNNDGLLKVVQDRNNNKMGLGKYVFPDRFKAGKKEIENRFFSPVMHVELAQWKGLGSDPDLSPQIVCLVPENISNTSRGEAQNTFAPKMCYYKGIISNVGWVFDNEEKDDYPYMFAVNYQEGGEDDPILSYSDERIGPEGDEVLGKGLLRRFFLQRMAIMRNGQYYNTWFRLKNIDITNYLHREHIICRGQKWELVEIKDYQPLTDTPTACTLRKQAPITVADASSVYPSTDNILNTSTPTGEYDMKYAPMKALISDIPTPE